MEKLENLAKNLLKNEINEKNEKNKIVYGWDIRFNFEVADANTIKKVFTKIAKKWCFKGEIGDGGYKHWQARISLFKKTTKPSLLKTLQDSLFKKSVTSYFIEPTVVKEHDNAKKGVFKYIEKSQTSITDIYRDDIVEKYIPFQVNKVKELRPWQSKVAELIKKPDDSCRKINILYNKSGNIGKTTFASWAEFNLECVDMPPITDSHYLMATACDILVAKDLHNPKGMFFDLPKGMDKKNLNSMYKTIEEIKKGKLYDVRNKYKEFWIDGCVNIWVFTNEMPNLKVLSEDRWNIFTIENDDLLQLSRVQIEDIGKIKKKSDSNKSDSEKK